MTKISISVAGQQFYAEATPEDLEALRRILHSTNYISWGIAIVGESEYNLGKEAADNRVSFNFKRIGKLLPKKKWWKLFSYLLISLLLISCKWYPVDAPEKKGDTVKICEHPRSRQGGEIFIEKGIYGVSIGYMYEIGNYVLEDSLIKSIRTDSIYAYWTGQLVYIGKNGVSPFESGPSVGIEYDGPITTDSFQKFTPITEHSHIKK
ncbi:MAG TPA: hypothetical protein VGZ90_13670 [Puia sp.]|nr:hypothetical protein [Puia sp.]